MTNKGPVALRKDYITEDGRKDFYHWLRDPGWPDVKDPQVLDYLKQENDYFDANVSKEKADSLYVEMVGRMEKADKSVPYLDNGFCYYSYILEEQQYWVHVRYKVNETDEEILIDENQLALDKEYLRVTTIRISPDHSRILYAVDFTGKERYKIYVKDISSGEIIDSVVDDVTGNIEWDKQGAGFLYTPAGQFWRPDRIFYHEIGTEKSKDKLVYEDKDNTFRVHVEKSKNKQFLFYVSKSSTASEFHFVKSDEPFQTPKCIHSRSHNHLYTVVHHNDNFYLNINDLSSNFRVVQVNVSNCNDWTEFVPPSDSYIQDIYAFEKHLVLLSRSNGLAHVSVINLNEDHCCRKIDVEDKCYEIFVDQKTYSDKSLRYRYSSLKTPETTIDYDFMTSEKKIMKVQVIPSGFDSSKYVLERIWAEVDHNVRVPISVIYNKEVAKLDGSDPLYLYGYGSYGYAISDNFRRQIFTLVDRGITYAIAHIRGGDELGKSWHETAKLLTKKNTFTDFIKSTEKLIEDKYTSPGNIVMSGASAAGLLIGYCINNKPHLYKGAIAHVPFVDVLSTMLDETLPLTPGEYKEWGNPKDKAYYDYIKSYSPYDNIKAQDYPNLFVTAGLSDPRVTYWEPAKWVALLRYTKTDDNLILLKTDMSSGHGGPSGRFEYLKEIALEYTFVLDLFKK